MSSDHPFDKHLKTSFDGFEPNVHANWAEFERSLEPTSSVPSQSSSTLNRWAVATAVAAGGALMWVAKPVVQDLMVEDGTEVVVELDGIEGEHPQTFDEAWEEFTNVTQGFVEDVMDAEAEAALLTEASEKAGSLAEADLPTSEQSSTALEQSTTPELDDVMVASVDVDASDTDASGMDVDKLLAELPFDASVREACEGVEVAFELTGLDRTMSFLWNFGDGNFSSDPAPKHVFDRPGTYDITLSVRPPGDGSISTRTIQNMITVLPKPEATFAWAFPATVSGRKVRVQLKDQTPNSTSVQWVVDGESSRDGLIQLDVPGVYPVNLVASNHHGCLDDAHHDIHIGDRHGLLAQARFSPNGDGHYDTFLPHSLLEMDKAWEMVVVDKDGEEVFRTSDARRPWDGTLPNGDVAKDRSTFVWTVRCMDLDGTPRLFTDRLRVER